MSLLSNVFSAIAKDKSISIRNNKVINFVQESVMFFGLLNVLTHFIYNESIKENYNLTLII